MARDYPTRFKNSQQPVSLGPMVDDGAPYSALGSTELRLLGLSDDNLDPIPSTIATFKYWQFGSGAHSSPAKPILGSTKLYFRSDSGQKISICHIVVSGSSPWLLGRNVTTNCDIIHLDGHYIRFKNIQRKNDKISLVNFEHHSYIPFRSVVTDAKNGKAINCLAGFGVSNPEQRTLTWPYVKRIVDRVHRHVCGHAAYSDIRTLLERNDMWTSSVKHYLDRIIQQCANCVKSSRPQPTRKVSLSSLNSSFNDTVYIDHMYLDDMKIFHAMDMYSRFSACVVTKSTSMTESIIAFQACWLNLHWNPRTVQADPAFKNTEFQQFADDNGFELSIIAPRRHNKNTLEPKHGVIRAIYTRLRASEPDANCELLAYRAISISNDLYGSDTVSSFELCRGFTKPLEHGHPIPVPLDIQEAHKTLQARRKLNLILRHNAVSESPIKVGDSVEIYVPGSHGKKGKWLSPRPVISYDLKSRTVTVPGQRNKLLTAAVEDVRVVIETDDLSQLVSEAIDKLDQSIEDSMTLTDQDITTTSDDSHSDSEVNLNLQPIDEQTDIFVNNENNNSQSRNNDNPDFEINDSSLDKLRLPLVGDKIEVLWPAESTYFLGVVAEVTDNNQHVIVYDDGDMETLTMDEQEWRFNDSHNENENDTGSTLQSSTVSHLPTLKSTEQTELQLLFDHFGNRPFLISHAQGFSQAAIINAYRTEEDAFKRTVREVSREAVPHNANVISSHVLYKLKINDDNSFKLKARIAPHGNKDSMQSELRSDCCMCSPTGLKIVLMTAAIFKWKLVKADVKNAFLQTGLAERDVYVIPPRESSNRKSLWLLLAAAYGLVNANSKWQLQSDTAITNMGLTQCRYIPQLFYMKKNRKTVLLVAKIVDDMLVTGETSYVKSFVHKFNTQFTLGTVTYGPGLLRFYGLNIRQYDDYHSTIDGDEKMDALDAVPITRSRRREVDEKLNDIERRAFMSINASINWLGITTSPICAFYSSFLQQRTPINNVGNLLLQSAVLRKLQKIGTQSCYPTPPKNTSVNVSVVVFADAGKSDDHGQLSYLGGILLGPLRKGSPFYPLSWSSHKSKRPVRSIGAAEILAVGEAVDEGKTLKSAVSTILGINVKLLVATDSKDLFNSLSTQRNSIDKSIRADVNLIRFEYETHSVNTVVWIPGKCNPADPGTKRDSPLTDVLRLMLYTGVIPIEFTGSQSRSSQRSLG